MLPVELYAPGEIMRGLAERARERRLDANLSREGLAERAGVSAASLKRFERTGAVSLESLVRIAIALDAAADFAALFGQKEWKTLDEVIAEPRKRMRGRRR